VLKSAFYDTYLYKNITKIKPMNNRLERIINDFNTALSDLDGLTDELENLKDDFEFDDEDVREHLGEDYIIVKVAKLNDKEKLLDYIKSEIYPYHADQEANIL
jgi:DNA repair ATPase RecN